MSYFVRASLAIVVSVAGSLLLSCSSDKQSKCLSEPVTLVDNALFQLADVQLARAATGVVMFGFDGTMAHWSTISTSGVAGLLQSFPLPAPTFGPWFAVTGKGVPGNQAIAVFVAPRVEGGTELELAAVVHTAGTTDTKRVSIAPIDVLDPATAKIAVGSSPTGMAAAVAIGYEGQLGVPVKIITLGPDAATTSTRELTDTPTMWKCLQFVPSRKTTMAVNLVRLAPVANNTPRWQVQELGDDGALGLSAQVTMSGPGGDELGCPVGAATASMYVFSWQAGDRTYAADYEPDSRAVTSNFVAGKPRFPDDVRMPPVVAATLMDFNHAVVFGTMRAPEVWLFDPRGSIIGDKLILPSEQTQVGPVDAVSAPGEIFLTYRDGATRGTMPTPSPGPRRFVKVVCPKEE
jgi:hypothetical protein